MNIRKSVNLLFIFILISLVANYFMNSYINIFKNAISFKTDNISKIFENLNDIIYFRGIRVSEPSRNGVCNLKILDPWNEDAKKLFKNRNPKPFECRKDTPLTYVHETRLFINQTVNTTFYSGSITKCHVAKVFFNYTLSVFSSLGKFKSFESGLKIADDAIKVRCWNKSNLLDYEYVHYVFQRFNKNKDELKYKKRMNVLIILFDSVSSSSFQRALPKTYEFLKSFENFYHFKKFHAVGQSTNHNLYPLLTGYSFLKRDDHATTHGGNYDSFPHIWQNYSSYNYTTYYMEEWNRKIWYRKSPTDHFFQYFWNSAYGTKTLPYAYTESAAPCYYDKLIHNVNMDLMRSFFKVYSQNNNSSDFVHQNYFMINFFVEMSHENLDRLFLMDDDVLAFLKETLTPSFLESTLLIVMGDHGHRVHPIRKTFTGKLEHSLPFFSFLVPQRLRKNNEILHQTLTQNTNTLATPYDIYETLFHLVLDQQNIHSTESKYLKDRPTRESSKNGFSMFLPLPDRDCYQAQIPLDMCICELGEKVKKLSKSQIKTSEMGAKFILDQINNVILKGLIPNKCVKYELIKIGKADFLTKDRISILIQTKPNDNLFEADLLVKGPGKFEILGNNIQRVSVYAQTSKCVKPNVLLLNFCYCASNLEKSESSSK